MQDRTPVYMMFIVGIVAILGIIVVLLSSQHSSSLVQTNTGITGNIVYSAHSTGNTFDFSVFGKIFFTIFLLGIAGYMYFKPD